jgi:MFS family permease
MRLNKNEHQLNLATFISNFGDGMHTLALGQILYEKTGQATSFGMIISLNYLLGIICQIYAGHLADRFVRSKLVKYADLGRGLVVLCLAASVYASLPAISIILLSLLIKIGTQIYRPAYYAMLSEAIPSERLSAFNSKNVAFMQGGQLLGMAFVGLLYSRGPGIVFAADASTFFISALIVHLMKIKTQHSEKSKTSVLNSWKDAFHHVKKEKGLLPHIFLSASTFLIFPIEELSIVPINNILLGGDKFWLSILSAMFSAGCIFSMLIMKFWSKEQSAYRWMWLQTLAWSILLFCKDSKIFASSAYFGLGLFSTMAGVQLLNRLMKRSPKSFQGRISALRYLVVSFWIATLIPFVTMLFAKDLNTGILGSTVVFCIFSFLCTVASRNESFLGDETILSRELVKST